MAKLPMIVNVEHHSHHEVRVRIQHDRSASYSRAVDPRAKKEMMAAMRSGRIPAATWGLSDSEYGLDEGEGGRCTSVIVFRRVG